jgi:hypothetical protein
MDEAVTAGADRVLPTPETLAEAHEVLGGCRPAHDASPSVWVEFHRISARVYSAVAVIDVAYRQEAYRWAGSEIRRARDIEDGSPDE